LETPPTQEPRDAPINSPVSLPAPLPLLRVWLGVGLQSFGGGSSTLVLIERAFVHQHGWIAEEEFTRLWALCQLAPGINLIALAILMGRRLGGALGIVLSVAGMLLPSVIVTVLLTASFARIRESTVAQAALRGILPATVGLGLLAAYRMAVPLLRAAYRRGTVMVFLSACLIAATGAAVLLDAQVIVVLLVAALVGAVVGGAWRAHENPTPDAGSP
jgi:chromate transporter